MSLRSFIAGFVLACVAATAASAADGGPWISSTSPEALAKVDPGRWAERTASGRIIGGVPVRAKEFPFLVGLVRTGVSDNFQAQYCAGSLIKPKVVLTAAHCVVGAPPFQILVGTHDLSRGGRRIDVATVVVHEDYNELTADYDIALVELKTAVRGIAPIPVIKANQEASLAAPGRPMLVIGWGNRSTTATDFPVVAHKVTVPVVSRAVCNGPASYGGQITERMMCAGPMAGGKDSCQGDSGGPLFTVRKVGGKRIQTGIVSWGDGCAKPNKPGVYTRLAVLGGLIQAKADAMSRR